MKSKNCEKLTEEYSHNCENFQIGIDTTDHIVFICNKCKNPLEVIEVISRIFPVSEDKKDICTWVYAVCHTCKTLGKRKFYWKTEDGRFCIFRTKCISEKELDEIWKRIEKKS